ncbi:MAG: ATP-dependent DNA helicase Rep [Proteobacteria bacterium]|nr:ATP-dependent DNA helicase Rep [Pseudomonadota bacterium]
MEVHTKPAPKHNKLDLSKLNPEQRNAVLHTEGPLLILAGAGSGKTNTMTHRIAYLIAEKGVPAHRILGLSFTNKASLELKDRVKSMLKKTVGVKAGKGLIVSTFHSLCVRILREYAPRLGYTSQFSILDPNDQESIVREILKHINIDAKKFDPSWVLFQIGQAKNKFLTGEQATLFFDSLKGPKIAYDDYSIALQMVFPRYQERLKLLNAMDFDDLLFNAVTLLEQQADVREALSRRFQYIMVDEYQDTNASQFRLLECLTSTHKNLCVVGDDDQSIYAWRGADPSHILGFEKQFPGTCKIILTRNYRSTENILNAANEVIAKNPKRYPKTLWSGKDAGSPIHMIAVEEDRAESKMVAEEILKLAESRASHRGDPSFRLWNDFAILYRSNSQSRIFEETLRMHQIPYKLVGALSFLDRKEVKDLLCYWKLVLNPKDDTAIRRVINWPARGIGKSSIELIHEHSVKAGCSFYESMTAPENLEQLNERTRKGIASFADLLDGLREELLSIRRENFSMNDGDFLASISEWAKRSLGRIGTKEALLKEEEEDPAKAMKRYENIDELANSIGLMDLAPISQEKPVEDGGTVLQEYLSQLVLNSKEEEDKEDVPQNALTLMTLHGAKGLEFPVVFLVGLEDGILPHQRTIDEGTDLSEERRLFYVGITRAREELYLTRAKNRVRYGKLLPRNPCRFLEDIPGDLILERDESSTPTFKSKEAEKRHEEEVMNFFAEIQKRLKKP